MMAITFNGVLGAALIMAMYSIVLYKEDSPIFRTAEHLFLGTAMAIVFLSVLKSILQTSVIPLVTEGAVVNIIPLFLGLALFLRFSENYRWLSNWGVAVIVAVGMGIGIRGYAFTYLLSQLESIVSVSLTAGGAMSIFNNSLMAIITLTVVFYFLFTFLIKAEKGSTPELLRAIARIMMMVMLGGMFGVITEGRFTLLAGNVKNILAGLGII
ncbi:hypothetical protein ACFL0D_07865 [Thermoproteota archaeon]